MKYGLFGIGSGISAEPAIAGRIAQAAEAGAQVRDVYWTFGGHDGVLILDAPDDETAARLFLSLGKTGAVRTQTLRAYDRQGFQAILNDLE